MLLTYYRPLVFEFSSSVAKSTDFIKLTRRKPIKIEKRKNILHVCCPISILIVVFFLTSLPFGRTPNFQNTRETRQTSYSPVFAVLGGGG